MSLVLSVAKFQDELEVLIARGDLDTALSLIEHLVDQVFCEPINTARVFSSKVLDDLCQKIGARSYSNLLSTDSSLANALKKNDSINGPVIYIVSKLQASGGHTAVLADIIRLGPSVKSVILVTGIGGATALDSIRHRFDSTPNVSFEFSPRGKLIGKLDWVQSRLVQLNPSDVWLFNHHQDSVAVAAVQPDAGYRLHFYHHGDHHLCLGVHLKYADHVDIHPMGYHYCRDQLNVEDNRYLPMTVKDWGARTKLLNFNCGSNIVTCSAAGFNKIEVPYFIRYVDVIPKLIQASGGKHIHIGRLTPLALSKIRRGMRKLGLNDSLFIYIPFVASVWKALHEYQVDLYITSFPYGGARTLIEVMGAGIPVAVHSHCTSRLLGTFDMAYKGAFIWRNPSELYYFVKSVDSDTLQSHSEMARNRYLEFHQEKTLISALEAGAEPLKAPDLYDGYTPDKLQEALDISNQVSCIGAINRFLYRKYRQWRSSRS